MPRRYKVSYENIAVSGAITIIQIKMGASSLGRIIRAWCGQTNLTTSAMVRMQLLRKTAAATVTSFTPLLLDPGDSASKAVGGTSATGVTATAEGTDGDILFNDTFNNLTPWLYLPAPEEREIIPPAGIIAMKFPVNPGMTVNAGIIFEEEGG